MHILLQLWILITVNRKSKQESMKDAAVVAALKTMQTGPRFSMDREKLEEVRTMYIS